MKIFSSLAPILLCGLLTACGGLSGFEPAPPPSSTPPPATGTVRDVMRVGDKVTIRLEGVPDGGYITEMQIPASGDVTVSLLTRSFHAAGRNAADLAAEITAAYKAEKIYTNPQVTVIPQDRYVNVGGDVRSPSRVLYTPDLTLLTTINSCGGFTEYANRRAVRIIRGQQIIQIDCVAANKTPGADPAVYPGDQIFVPRTIF